MEDTVFQDRIHPPYVIAHRIDRFLSMGFDQHDADLLSNTRADTHAVQRMIAAGCSIELAIRILL